MEEIFNKIIEIDKNAKTITVDEKEKKENIEDYIESEFNTKKVVLDLEFKEDIEFQRKKTEELFEEKKKEIDTRIEQEIESIEKYYKENEYKIIKNIVASIKKEEE